MEFFVENWVWFLVGGIIILMTIIGYIAEKTDFGRKEITKKEKPEKKQKEIIEEKNTEPEVQMSLATNTILEEPVEKEIEPLNEEIEIPEELTVPFGDLEKQSTANFVDEVVAEDFSEPSLEQSEYVQTPEVELPDLESIVSENSDDDDDVWKF